LLEQVNGIASEMMTVRWCTPWGRNKMVDVFVIIVPWPIP